MPGLLSACQVSSGHISDEYFVFEECSVLISPLLIPSTKVTTEIRNKCGHSLSLYLKFCFSIPYYIFKPTFLLFVFHYMYRMSSVQPKKVISSIIWDSFREIAPRLKCYKNASRLNRYNFPTDNAIDFLFSTLHTTPFTMK